MISDNASWDQFVTEHRWAVLTTLRANQPVSSVVAYARDGDELIVSTPGSTFKARSIAANTAVALCILSNAEPFNFVSVEGQATVTRDNLEQDTRRLFRNIEAAGYSAPPDLPQWLEQQQRVIVRIYPRRVYGVIR